MAYEKAIEALADPTRRAVFERLRRGPQPVGRIAEGLDVSRPAVSQHLKVLHEAGLVRVRSQGTRRIYGVEVRGLRALRGYLDRLWDDALSAFEADAGTGAAGRPRRRKHGKR
jgi:DNA-binding transcriptional ArsR family regulator